MIREERAGKAESKLVGIEAARANGFSADFSEFKPHRPSFIGTKAIDDVTVDTLIPYIDWTPFFRAWELAGTYPSIRSEEHTSELPSLMRITYAAFCLKKKHKTTHDTNKKQQTK